MTSLLDTRVRLKAAGQQQFDRTFQPFIARLEGLTAGSRRATSLVRSAC